MRMDMLGADTRSRGTPPVNPSVLGLTAAQQALWRDQGYLVIPGMKSASDVAALRQRAQEIVASFDPGRRPRVFATHDQARRSADQAFMDSAHTIECFLEEQALDEQGQLCRPVQAAVNKIGHALHEHDEVFARFTADASLQAVATGLGMVDPRLWQSMVIIKPPGIGAEVRWHQDATFLFTTPQRVVGFWFALEDADRDNGCLWVAPGAHRGPLRERFVRRRDATDGPLMELQTLHSQPWPTMDQAVALEVSAGTLVCLHGLLPHYSAPNRSGRSRLAYTVHAADAACTWSADNWLQRNCAAPRLGQNS